jgi:CheY-like chemotaxis protein
MNVLIVDDHAMNRKLLRAQLEAEGHAILEAGDGVEALAVLEGEQVDAIISDILMPNLDGFGLCLAVRRHERLRAMPFVFYTATYTSASDMQFARTVGANRYLTKPAPVPELIAALRDASFQGTLPVPPVEADVLRQYNVALLQKLEDKTAALEQTVQKLERAHERIAELNRILERRTEERTAELPKANGELREALGQVRQSDGTMAENPAATP